MCVSESQASAKSQLQVLVRVEHAESVDSTKEKRSWFHSLTRRKKSDSALVALPTSSDAVASSSTHMQNNNNEVCVPNEAGSSGGDASMIIGSSSSHSNGGTLRKRKDKRNVFSRLRRKEGQGLSSLRNWNSMGDSDSDGDTTDATYEFLTPSIFVEPTLPFTHDYLRFIQKKWLERLDTPNEVMYKACLEMLNQVWYSGEISRRDAQRQLSDKSAPLQTLASSSSSSAANTSGGSGSTSISGTFILQKKKPSLRRPAVLLRHFLATYKRAKRMPPPFLRSPSEAPHCL